MNNIMTTQQNKKLTLGILLTFIICIGSAILAAYSTGPYGNYPNPGMHPGMIGPGTFNDSGVANPLWKFLGNLDIKGNTTVQGSLKIDKGLVIGNPVNGSLGDGTINVEKLYVNGSELDIISEEKYCKRTSTTYNGNLGGLAGADAKCVAEFGAGWSFVNTETELSRLLSQFPELYISLPEIYFSGYDGESGSFGWMGRPIGVGFETCSVWTVNASSDGGVLIPHYNAGDGYGWKVYSRDCSNLYNLWCCPL